MKMTYIAIAVASLMMGGGGVALAANSGTNISFNNRNATTVKAPRVSNTSFSGSGDWVETFKGYGQIVKVTVAGTYAIGGYDNVDLTHYQTSDHAILHAENGTLQFTAGEVKLTGVSSVEGKDGPILIHGFGGTVEVAADRSITLETSNNSVMAQALPGKSNGIVKFKAGGDVNVKSKGSAVLVGLLQKGLNGKQSGLEITAGGNVNIVSTKGTALTIYNRNQEPHTEWNSDSGSAYAKIKANGVVNLDGALYGVFQGLQQTGNSTSSLAVNAGEAINVTGTDMAVYMTGLVENGNSAVYTAPVVSFTATKTNSEHAAIYIKEKSNLTVGDGLTDTQVKISAANGKAVQNNAGSSLLFEKSTVLSEGSVASKGTLGLNNSSLELAGSSTLNAASVTGKNGRILVNEVAKDGKTVTITNNQNTGLEVGFTGAANDQYATTDEAAQALASAMKVTNGADGSYTFSGQSGAVSDGWTADATGRVLTRTGNEAMSAVGNFNAMTLVQWRSEGNHIVQRLGDVRDGSGKVGAWARVYGYDSSYSDGISMDFKANSIQAGGDYRVNDAWLVGGAFSYTDGEGAFSNGSSDSDGYSLAAYLSGFFNCGAYVDFVGRVGRLSTDITAASQSSVFKGSYDNTTFGLSAEVGYHWSLTQTFYVEPQAELTYGFVKGDDFTGTNGVSISQDDFQTLVGRLGARVGASFADGAGTVYAHASVNHDFLGDADFTATSGASRDFSVDLGGTWFSYGVGAQFNTSKNINFYGVLERSNGSEYDEDYRYGVGMRYAF